MDGTHVGRGPRLGHRTLRVQQSCRSPNASVFDEYHHEPSAVFLCGFTERGPQDRRSMGEHSAQCVCCPHPSVRFLRDRPDRPHVSSGIHTTHQDTDHRIVVRRETWCGCTCLSTRCLCSLATPPSSTRATHGYKQMPTAMKERTSVFCGRSSQVAGLGSKRRITPMTGQFQQIVKARVSPRITLVRSFDTIVIL